MDHVDRTLQLWRSRPFTWGGCVPHEPGRGDCLLSVGEYIAEMGCRDVTGLFRGAYSDEASALALVSLYGGPQALIDLTGLPRTDEPGRGDVVVFDPTGQGDGIGALCTGPGIASRLERGVIEVDRRLVKILHAWKVPQ